MFLPRCYIYCVDARWLLLVAMVSLFDWSFELNWDRMRIMGAMVRVHMMWTVSRERSDFHCLPIKTPLRRLRSMVLPVAVWLRLLRWYGEYVWIILRRQCNSNNVSAWWRNWWCRMGILSKSIAWRAFFKWRYYLNWFLWDEETNWIWIDTERWVVRGRWWWRWKGVRAETIARSIVDSSFFDVVCWKLRTKWRLRRFHVTWLRLLYSAYYYDLK